MPRHRPRPPVAALAAWALATLLVVRAQDKPSACQRTHIYDWTNPETGSADYTAVMGGKCTDEMSDCKEGCKNALQRVRDASRLQRPRCYKVAVLRFLGTVCPLRLPPLLCCRWGMVA